jgi:hypothetical protein
MSGLHVNDILMILNLINWNILTYSILHSRETINREKEEIRPGEEDHRKVEGEGSGKVRQRK